MAENSGKPEQTSKPSKDTHENKTQTKPEPTPNPSKGIRLTSARSYADEKGVDIPKKKK